MTRVFVTDDHPVVRAGLVALLAAQEGIDIVGQASTGEEAMTLVAHLDPDVVLMDLQLGAGMDGVETTRRLRADKAERRVLILTTYDTDADIVRAIEAGAAGYLLKDADPATLVAGVVDAAAGRTVLAPVVASRLDARLSRPRQELTSRELEVLRLTSEGLSNRAIARELFVSEATVKTHLVHVFEKLGVDSRTSAVAEARSSGLIR
ncbi:MAG TPA: response regulator transcription factor [Propionibacteriaceae bacterium]|nr:response regulator transcription factor [Propionibacteriaceae bacterium]